MKYKLILLLCLFIELADAQSGQWTWMKGDSSGQIYSYGIKGVANSSNLPPCRYNAAYWTDLNGNFWMFGGMKYPSLIGLNDLWKFDPVSNLWTWMGGDTSQTGAVYNYGVQGVPSLLNWPPTTSYGVNNWVDHHGCLWYYGGQFLDDLWRYNISTSEWTWMKGSQNTVGETIGTQGIEATTNKPGSIGESKSSFVDWDGNFWLFGGISNLVMSNRIWKYNVSTNNWTWVRGTNSNTTIYGTLNVPHINNEPSARYSYTNAIDKNDNFYIYSGTLYDNETWRYNRFTNEWTWLGGNGWATNASTSNIYCQNNQYPLNEMENRSINIPCSNYFWNLGQHGLWLFDIINNKWTLASGNINGSAANFGTLGVPSINNAPGSRTGHCLWQQNNGSLWVFGGILGFSSNLQSGSLWRYTPDTSCIHLNVSNLTTNILSFPTEIKKCDTTPIIIPTNKNFISNITSTGSFYFLNNDTLILNPHQSATYTVTTLGGCYNTDTNIFTIQILISPMPTACFEITTLTADQSRAVLNFKNKSINYDSVYWYIDGQFVTSADSIFTLPIGAYTISLIAVNSLGCADTFTSNILALPKTIKQCNTNPIQINTNSLLIKNIYSTESYYFLNNTKLVLTPKKTTNYIFTTIGGCTHKDTILDTLQIIIDHPPIASFTLSPTSTSLDTPFIHFVNNSAGATTCYWHLNGAFYSVNDTILTMPKTGHYCITLVARNSLDCADTVTKCFTITAGSPVKLEFTVFPNAFTPNNDNHNDNYFPILSDGIELQEFKIFNRWGQLIFSGVTMPWDGAYLGVPQPMGVFVYYAKTKSMVSNNITTYKGNFSLLR